MITVSGEDSDRAPSSSERLSRLASAAADGFQKYSAGRPTATVDLGLRRLLMRLGKPDSFCMQIGFRRLRGPILLHLMFVPK
jgi:hypothetical protein